MRKANRRAQSVVEYAVLFSVVAAVVIGMQLYVKRGAQAKLKQASDHFALTTGDAKAGGPTLGGEAILQYEPYYTAAGNYTTGTNNTQIEQMTAGGQIARTGINNTTTRTGKADQNVDITADNAWNAAKNPGN